MKTKTRNWTRATAVALTLATALTLAGSPTAEAEQVGTSQLSGGSGERICEGTDHEFDADELQEGDGFGCTLDNGSWIDCHSYSVEHDYAICAYGDDTPNEPGPTTTPTSRWLVKATTPAKVLATVR